MVCFVFIDPSVLTSTTVPLSPHYIAHTANSLLIRLTWNYDRSAFHSLVFRAL